MSESTGSRAVRVGQGYDIHRLEVGRPLVLGGITIPSEVGLTGHSDGDAVCHAVTDAMLGAAGMGDIGSHFPDTDPQWKDASSLALLEAVAGRVRNVGYAVENVDVTVVLEVPRLGPYRDGMVAAVAGALRVDAGRVSIKAKTNERLGAMGAGEAIAALAVVLLSTSG